MSAVIHKQAWLLIGCIVMLGHVEGFSQASTHQPSRVVTGHRLDQLSGIRFIWIPKGDFVMGSDRTGTLVGGELTSDEQPPHRVAISNGFWMGETAVTVGQFKRFIAATKYITTAEKNGAKVYTDSGPVIMPDANWKNPYINQDDSHPVVCVTWDDTQAYIKWLNSGGKQKYSLPSEAEREYATRANSTEDYIVDFNSIGWTGYNSGMTTHPVAGLAANSFGLYDMCGNVHEWCQDWYDPNFYPISPSVNPEGPMIGKFRTWRGVSWHDRPTANYRITCRAATRPNVAYIDLGFRIKMID